MIKPFAELGAMAAANWSKLGGHDEAFPEAATTALAESGVLNNLDASDIIDWLATSHNIPEQYAKEFGQPPINVYVADKFFIQVLFWIDATTAVHAHSFAGAFGVLAGSSVHSQYQFDLVEPLAKELQLGHVRYVSSELLKRGDLRTIHFGSSFIHSLFHLDRPSVSVVVRTKFVQDAVQYSYLTPHVAVDPFFKDAVISIKLRLLESLQTVRSDQFWRYANLLITENAAWMAYNALTTAYKASRADATKWRQLLDTAKETWGDQNVEWMLASIKLDERGSKLSRLRSVVHDPNYRFLLALLLNVPSRNTLLRLMAHQFDTKFPEVLIMQWLREMSVGGLFLARLAPELLDVIELGLRYNTFQEARSAVTNGSASYPALMDEEKMRTLWLNASSSSFFQPLFETAEGSKETLASAAA